MIEPTAEEAEVLRRLRAALEVAKYPRVYRVSRSDLETVEGYLSRMKDDSIQRYVAAGSPEDWREPLWVYCGPNFGPMFKGVELLEEKP